MPENEAIEGGEREHKREAGSLAKSGKGLSGTVGGVPKKYLLFGAVGGLAIGLYLRAKNKAAAAATTTSTAQPVGTVATGAIPTTDTASQAGGGGGYSTMPVTIPAPNMLTGGDLAPQPLPAAPTQTQEPITSFPTSTSTPVASAPAPAPQPAPLAPWQTALGLSGAPAGAGPATPIVVQGQTIGESFSAPGAPPMQTVTDPSTGASYQIPASVGNNYSFSYGGVHY